jgi:hypothetical protein
MPRAIAAKFALSLVALLILGQLQCVAACVSFFSSQAANSGAASKNLPPCYRHQDRHQDSKHSGNSSSDACLHESAAAGIVAQTVSAAPPQLAGNPGGIHLQLLQAPFTGLPIAHAVPPRSVPSSVLRV